MRNQTQSQDQSRTPLWYVRAILFDPARVGGIDLLIGTKHAEI